MRFSHCRLLARIDSSGQKGPRRPSTTRKTLATSGLCITASHHHAHLTEANAHPFSRWTNCCKIRAARLRAELALSEDVFGHRRSEGGLWTSCDQRSLLMVKAVCGCPQGGRAEKKQTTSHDMLSDKQVQNEDLNGFLYTNQLGFRNITASS